MKTLIKRPTKIERERKVLLGFIELFLKERKPIGSNTLRENGFKDLSSATIRNYFAHLEKEDYLKQAHSSGGRIPTPKAFRFYADTHKDTAVTPSKEKWDEDVKEISEFLQRAGEKLSEKTHLPVFLSTPLFEMDFIQKLHLIRLDPMRLLCVMITDFGLIRTETLYLPENIDDQKLQDIEHYFYWRLSKKDKPEIDEAVLKSAQRLYNELMVRYVVESSNVQSQNIFKMGLSKLLNYPEFCQTADLASGLAIFENPEKMQSLLKHTVEKNDLVYLIGEDLSDFVETSHNCSIILIPYHINQIPVGALALLGPLGLSYRDLFATMRFFSENISQVLTKNVYKYKIAYKTFHDAKNFTQNLADSSSILLEDKSNT